MSNLKSSAILICKREASYLPAVHDKILEGLRVLALRWYRRSIYLGFIKFLKDRFGETVWRKFVESGETGRKRYASFGKEFLSNLEVGREALERCLGSSWWEWTEGSCLLFWKWPESLLKESRDGAKVWTQGVLPTNWGLQYLPKQEEQRL